jgi:hypothetical protein
MFCFFVNFFLFFVFQQRVVLATETNVAATMHGKRGAFLLSNSTIVPTFSSFIFVNSEATRRPFESPAIGATAATTATIANTAAGDDDDVELTMANRPLPSRRVAHVSSTPQVTPLVTQRRTKKSSLTVAADDNAANNARSLEVPSPTVSRKRVFDSSAAAAAAAERTAQRPAPVVKRSRAQPEPVFAVPVLDVSLNRGRLLNTQVDTMCAIVLDAAVNQAKRSGNRPWIAQFHTEVTDEFDALRAKVETQSALARRVRQMKADIDSARVGSIEAAHERAAVDAQLRAETADCELRRAAVDRKAQLSNWLRQLQTLKEQARGAPRDQLTHQIVPNEALDMVRAARHARLLAARLRDARAVGAQSDAAIAALSRNP